MIGWKEHTIDEITKNIIDYRGKTPTKTLNGVKLITAKVIKNGVILQNANFEYISEDDYDTVMRRGIPQQNDILITTEAPLGEIAMIRSTEKIALAQRVILLRINPNIAYPHFIYHSLKSNYIQGRIYVRGTGTTVLGIKNVELRKVKIPLPPLPTQQKIANILSAYDDLIENNQKRIRILEQMAQNLYKEWFVRFRFPNYENTEFVDGLPKAWMPMVFTDIVSILNGGTPSTKVSSYWNGDIPFFSPKDTNNSFFCFETEATITEQGLKKCSSRKFKEDTIFITARGTVGKIVLNAVPMAMNQSNYALVGKNRLNQFYLFLVLSFLVIRLQKQAIGATFNAITVRDFESLKIIHPPKEILLKFDKLISPIFQEIKILSKKNLVLKQTRNRLLPRLLSGKLEV